jgi:hypothetical protein
MIEHVIERTACAGDAPQSLLMPDQGCIPFCGAPLIN